MFELPTQPSSIVLEIAKVRATIHLIKQDNEGSDREISKAKRSHDPGESTLSSDIEEDDLANQHEIVYLVQARRDKTIWTRRVPPPKKWNHADTVIAHSSLPNLQHPVGAIAPLFLNRPESAINILRELDVIPAQALPLPKAGGHQNVLQPKAGGDHNGR